MAGWRATHGFTINRTGKPFGKCINTQCSSQTEKTMSWQQVAVRQCLQIGCSLEIGDRCKESGKSKWLLVPLSGKPKGLGQAKTEPTEPVGPVPHITLPLMSASWTSTRLFSVVPIEYSEQSLVENWAAGDLWPLLQAVPLPVYQVQPNLAIGGIMGTM